MLLLLRFRPTSRDIAEAKADLLAATEACASGAAASFTILADCDDWLHFLLGMVT